MMREDVIPKTPVEAVILTTQSDHERRLSNLENMFTKVIWWLIGIFGSTASSAALLAIDVTLRLKGMK